MKMIVGLGNPGSSYRHTRHNAGFLALDELANKFSAHFSSKSSNRALRAEVYLGSEKVLLIKPQSFMNNSGPVVCDVFQENMEHLEDLLIVLDDVSLPLGTLRLRLAGSDGGHNGLASILNAFQTEAVPRLRLGVGPAPAPETNDLADYVLANFSKLEWKAVEDMLNRTQAACLSWVQYGAEETMQKFNASQEAS